MLPNKEPWLDDYYPEHIISEVDLQHFEEENDISLPLLYKKHLLERNGGRPARNAIPTLQPSTWSADHQKVSVVLGLRQEEGISDTNVYIKEWGLPENIVVFAYSDDNAFFYFDYKQSKNDPPVMLYEPDGNLKEYKLADNYVSFIEKLYTAAVDTSEDEEMKKWLIQQEKKWSDLALIDTYIQEDNLEQLLEGIIYCGYSEDFPLVLEKVIKLSHSKHSPVREAAAEVLANIAAYSADEVDPHLLDKAILRFTKDPNPDVRYYIEELLSQ